MILVDVSTSFMFRHLNPVGILRVELEVVKTFQALQKAGESVAFGVYNEEKDAFFELSFTDYKALSIDKTWKNTPSKRVGPLPRFAAQRVLRVARFMARLGKTFVQARLSKRSSGLERRLSLGKALTDISEADYIALRPRIASLVSSLNISPTYMQRLDEINFEIQTGIFDYQCMSRFSDATRVDPDKVTNLVCAGAFWSDARHKYAFRCKYSHAWRLHYMIYDLIPIQWRHLTEPTTKMTFPLALHWVLWSVDQFWTISETTKQDLLGYIDDNGYPNLAGDHITPTYLGSDIGEGDTESDQATEILARFGLEAQNFVLMVGTLEPRKNHDFAYRVWKELKKRRPDITTPMVWVGQAGWAIDPLLQQVVEDYELPHGAIQRLTNINDKELAVLYRKCRFGILPAHYEGWGLPVVETLAYGRPMIASDAPAIVEASKGKADHIGILDGEAWLQRMETLLGDGPDYDAAVARAQEFDAFKWEDFRTQLSQSFQDFSASKTKANQKGTKA